MALPRTRAAIMLLLFLYTLSTFAASLQSNNLILSNISSSDALSLLTPNDASDNDGDSDCFNPAIPREGLYPARTEDCFNAAKDLFAVRDPFRAITFARRPRVGFQLPKVFRSGTCVISIDVMNDDDKDVFKPWLVYITAREIASRCTEGAFRFGGRTMTGPKMVVDVLVFGRDWPLEKGVVEPTASESAVVVSRERLATVANEISLTVTKTMMTNTTTVDSSSNSTATEVGRSLECNDPPLPRERAWPIDFEDCQKATNEIYGDREHEEKYTFSREVVATKFYYPLPATFRNRSCVVHLDMNNDSDQDTVRLSIVEATAYVLAHKCSGEEKTVDQYGGRATVVVGARGLINVWVYGRPWPPPFGATNVTSLVLDQPAPLLDNE